MLVIYGNKEQTFLLTWKSDSDSNTTNLFFLFEVLLLKTPEDVKTIIRITNSKTRMILLRFFDLVETEFPMNHSVIFNLVSKVVHCFFGFVSLRWDWLRKLEPLSQPMRFKAKTNCQLVTRVFPRCSFFVPIWLLIGYLSCLSFFFWCWFYNTPSKSSLYL